MVNIPDKQCNRRRGPATSGFRVFDASKNKYPALAVCMNITELCFYLTNLCFICVIFHTFHIFIKCHLADFRCLLFSYTVQNHIKTLYYVLSNSYNN